MAESPRETPAPARLKVLFVCTLNQWRSPTAEALYRGHPRLEVRSAGIRSNARRRIKFGDIKWADLIFVMELDHKRWIQEQFRGAELPPIRNLEITANLHYMDSELQHLLRTAIDPEIEALLGP
ncbi:MAG: protein-tyrosine-phosphatase [Opitutaceae bacterium]|jgi:predicted protein tyrosine phosphatase